MLGLLHEAISDDCLAWLLATRIDLESPPRGDEPVEPVLRPDPHGAMT